MRMLIRNIKALVGIHDPHDPLRGDALSILPILEQAYLVVEDGRIASFGSMDALQADEQSFSAVLDATEQYVLPTWCDSHTHIVFAATREEEFVDKIRGKSYAEIAANGGGILNSARKLQAASEDQLYELAFERIRLAIRLGTGAMEIKSGYGLTTESELKMLRVIRRLKENAPIPIRVSFLGAHAYPENFRDNHEGYIRSIIDDMLPKVAGEGLADYVDVFCEGGFFSPEETARILQTAAMYGLKPKIHANQLSVSGGVEVGVAHQAISVDHLECMDEQSIDCLASSKTIGTLLPGCALFLRSSYPPARELVQRGAAIALASDYNPGSSPSYNMNLVVALACSQMRLLPEEALNAATINGAFAMELDKEVGSIAVGKRANLIFTRPMNSLAYLPYSFGENLIERVMLNGIFQ